MMDTRPSILPYRIFTIGCVLFMAIAMIGTAFLYYSIFCKVKKDGFKNYSSGSNPSFKSASDSVTNKSSANLQQAAISAPVFAANYQRQVSVTKKLAFMTIIYFSAWFPLGVAFLYETVTGEYFSKDFDFFAACMAFIQGMSNSLVILFLDNRWKVNMPSWLRSKNIAAM
ncbi:hypothetical protein BKA69DRAFT_1167729 [Paraphysoderma sedebokerense]|nr:hypothetical protein BKA69DRAFT_1167729 [Paraphysoderma sedebokerense]